VPCMGDLRCEAPMIVGIRSSWRESRSIKVSRNRGRTSQAAFTMIDSYRAASLFRSDVIANSIGPQRDRLLLRPCSRLPLRRSSGARQAQSAGGIRPRSRPGHSSPIFPGCTRPRSSAFPTCISCPMSSLSDWISTLKPAAPERRASGTTECYRALRRRPSHWAAAAGKRPACGGDTSKKRSRAAFGSPDARLWKLSRRVIWWRQSLQQF